MNKNDNRFTEALASALHKMLERERSGAVDCYGWDYQPKRVEKPLARGLAQRSKPRPSFRPTTLLQTLLSPFRNQPSMFSSFRVQPNKIR